VDDLLFVPFSPSALRVLDLVSDLSFFGSVFLVSALSDFLVSVFTSFLASALSGFLLSRTLESVFSDVFVGVLGVLAEDLVGTFLESVFRDGFVGVFTSVLGVLTADLETALATDLAAGLGAGASAAAESVSKTFMSASILAKSALRSGFAGRGTARTDEAPRARTEARMTADV